MIVIDLSSHKFNPVYAQTCLFKGNLQAENAPVQSVASGERRKKNMIVNYLSSHKIQSCVCTNVSIQGQLTD